MTVEVTYLELTDPAGVRPGRRVPGARVERVTDPAVNRAMYEGVGRDHAWTDRLGWSEDAWAAHAARVETWVAVLDGERAGYAELHPRGPDVEIASFGLLPRFQGRGLGGHLLTEALRRAFALPGARRVWLHTCTLDGPHALANYEARGLVPYRRETIP